jgi:EAL domain-containing protein (putative c-di-GMP-specific phosphodiesterase class I)/GGDEF domain-containing protein
MNPPSRGLFEIADTPDAPADSALTVWQRRLLSRLAIELPDRTGNLSEAIGLVIREVTDVLNWSAAHARYDMAGRSGTDWHVRATEGASLSKLANLQAALSRGPVAGWQEGNGKGPGCRLDPLKSLPKTKARDAARSAGFVGYVLLPVLAEGRPVALLEFFAPAAPLPDGSARPSEIGDAIELIGVQLGLIASRQRLREAVRQAADHTRHLTTELDSSHEQLARVKAESRLYDESSGLPGRTILDDRIRQAVLRRHRSPRDLFVVSVAEMDGLGRLSDRIGEQVAQDVLVAAARRLTGHTRPSDTVAIDEPGRFVVVVEGIRTVTEAQAVADRLLKELVRPYPAKHKEVRLDARIGIVMGGPAYDEPGTLLADARAAARRAESSQVRIQVFDRSSEENHEQNERMRGDLAKALDEREFYVEYQPIVLLQDGSINGLEALLRWRHPELGVVPPDQFLPLAADSAVVHDIGFWVLDQTCEQISLWRDKLMPQMPPLMSVNVLGRQVFHEGFVARMSEIMEQHAIEGGQIRFDIREAELMRDAAKAASLLDRLHGMGIGVAVDDFGTGFSSLPVLHDLQVCALKIDRSLISQRREKRRKWSVARSIVEIAGILGVDAIAEGIESREQLLALKQAGCTQAQGFYFSEPVAAEQAEAMIRGGYPIDLESPRR